MTTAMTTAMTTHMNGAGPAWKAILRRHAHAFGAPSFTLFCELVSAWVCATGRRTICGMVAVMDPASRRAHDAYHRFVRAGAWHPDRLWATIVALAVDHVDPGGPIVCLLDDTLMHRHGPNVNGAGSYRDAVRSTHSRIVFALRARRAAVGRHAYRHTRRDATAPKGRGETPGVGRRTDDRVRQPPPASTLHPLRRRRLRLPGR